MKIKRILCILLSLCIMIGFSSCGKDKPNEEVTDNSSTTQTYNENTKDEIKVISLNKEYISHYEWYEDTSTMLVRSEYSDVTLDKSMEKEYSLLAQVLLENSAMRKRAMEDEKDNILSFAAEEFKEDRESFSTYVSTLDVQVRRADNVVVSILEDYATESTRSFRGYNYDTQTGKLLTIDDVVTDTSKIPAVVEKELMSRVGLDEPYGETAVSEYFKNTDEEYLSWTLDYNGVTFYFNAGEIAPTNFGIQVVTVTFAQYADLFNKKYTVVPDSYIVSLPFMSSFFTDFTDDGRSEELIVSGDYDPDDEYYYTLSIYSENSSYEVDWFAYDLYPYYVRTADGGNFLYVFSDLSNEEDRQMTLCVLSLNGGEIKQVCEKNIGLLYNDNNSFAVPTSPDNLRLYNYDNNSPLLNFMVSEDGTPISK